MPLTQTERDALLEQVEDLIARFTETLPEPGTVPPASTPSTIAGYQVVGREVLPDGFQFRWPKASQDTAYRANRIPTAQYRLRADDGEYTLLLGEERGGRDANGRKGRGRITVFVRHGGGGLYPLVEWAETDEVGTDGEPLYAAAIPRPEAPSKLVRGGEIPALRATVQHLADADVRRADQVYAAMKNGPSMRLLVSLADTERMLVHALWVGRLRRRLPRPA